MLFEKWAMPKTRQPVEKGYEKDCPLVAFVIVFL
jgi:hypothetical protein